MYSSVQVNSQRIVHSRLAQCLYSEWINSSSSKCSGSSVVLGSVITWLAVLKAPFAFILRSRNGVNATCNLRKFRKKLRLFFRELQRTQPIHRHSRMSTADSCQVHYQRALCETFILTFFVVALCVRIDQDRFGFLCLWFSQTSRSIHATDHPL